MKAGKVIGRLVAVIAAALFSCGYAIGQDLQIQSVDYDVIRDIAYGPHALQKFDIALPFPRPAERCPVYVWFHGGGYIGGDKSTPGPFMMPEANYCSHKRKSPRITPRALLSVFYLMLIIRVPSFSIPPG